MTKDKDLKRLAHERAAKTGESYSTARRQLVSKESEQRPTETTAAQPWMGLSEAARIGAPLARDEARIAGHPWIEPEHVLLGLLSHGGVLPALHAMRVSPVALRHHVERALAPKRDVRVDPTMSVATMWTIELAHEEAASRGQEAVEPQDLLIGLSRLTRPVRNVLDEFGASEFQLRTHFGYDNPSIESVVRAAIVNRLLPLIGQTDTRAAALVGPVRIDEVENRTAVTVTSDDPRLLARFADDMRLAAETILGNTAIVNVSQVG